MAPEGNINIIESCENDQQIKRTNVLMVRRERRPHAWR